MAVKAEARAVVDASREAIWTLVADTERLNRAIGLRPVHYRLVADGGTPVLEGQFRVLGLPVARWTEHPFEWEAPRYYSVRRVYHSGPFREVLGGVELTPATTDGTEIRAWVEITPRQVPGAQLAGWLVARRGTQSVIRQCRLIEAYLLGRAPSPFPQRAPQAGVAVERLDALAEQLVRAGREASLVERLRGHVAEAPDLDVSSMRPFELADRWAADRRAVLALCLHATLVGLLELSWHVHCPNCRVSKVQYTTLRALEREAHCDTCRICYDVDFDHLVEVRFDPSPAVRKVVRQTFCVGGPLNSPHVLAQTAVPSGERRTLAVRLDEHGYRVRSARGGTAALRVRDGADAVIRLALGGGTLTPAEAEIRRGEARVIVENQDDAPMVVVLEDMAWVDTAATGAIVGTVPEFRDLFSAEVLAPGLEVRIQRLAFLFTDLAGSTALYERIGEARAFRLVQEHFRILAAVVGAHRGAVVKTIGDAIMAVFPSAADAFEAALVIQREIRGLDGYGVVDPSRLVRVGVHEGPCVAVTLNQRLDYFGTTVNMAARVEHECRGGEVVVSAAVLQDQDLLGRLAALPVRVEPFAAQLRGIRGSVHLYRLVPQWPDRPDARAPGAATKLAATSSPAPGPADGATQTGREPS